MLILMRKENEQDQAYIFQDTYFEGSQKYLLTIMHQFEYTNYDILLNFLFQKILTNSFSVRVTCISNIFHI